MYKELVKNKNFMLLTLGCFISSIGDYLYTIAITVSLYTTTKSLIAVTLMWLSRAIFRIPVQYIAGILTDRFNKKTLIVVTNLISILAAFLFIFVTKDTLWLAYLLAFILQSLNDIDTNSESAILPELVNKERLSYANSVFSILESVSIFLSPALAGLIYKSYGSSILYKINSYSFFFASILFMFIKYNHEKSVKTASKTKLLKSGIEGFSILSKYIEVKNLFIIATIYAVIGRFYEVYKVVVADKLLNINADGIIYFDYALAIGGLLVPLAIKYFSKHSKVKAYLTTSTIISLGYLVFGYSTNFIATFIVLIVLGTSFSLQGIFSRTIIQENIPREFMGRVFSFYKILLTFFAILGLLIANPIYNSLGIGNGFLILSVISIFLCGKQFFNKKRKARTKEECAAERINIIE